MTNILSAIAQRNRAVVFFVILLLLLGYQMYKNIAKEKFPDVVFPVVHVGVYLVGSTPTDNERLITKPLDNVFMSLGGLKRLRSTSSDGASSFSIQFDHGTDIDEAKDEIRDSIDSVRQDLPSGIEEPIISEISAAKFPIMTVFLSSNQSIEKTVEIAELIRSEIEGLPQVLEVDIIGDLDETIDIIVDPLMLKGSNLVDRIISSVRSDNAVISSGFLTTEHGSYSVEVPAIVGSDILSLADKVVMNNGYKSLLLSDVAELKNSYREQRNIAFVDGEPTIALEISKKPGANLIELSDSVRQIMKDSTLIQENDITVNYSNDVATEVKSRLSDFNNSVILSVVLVLFTTVLMIGGRSAYLISFSIPLTFLLSISIIYFFGMALNTVLLFALVLSVGMVVDNAIVITEYADSRLVEGASIKVAYIDAIKEMATPIFSSTISTIIVFLPLMFWPGTMGQFMKYLPITLIITLLSSFFIATTVIPAFGTLASDNKVISEQKKVGLFGSIKKKLIQLYQKLLSLLLTYYKLSLSIIILSSVLFMVFAMKFIAGVEFFPKIEDERAMVSISVDGNLSLDEKTKISFEVLDKLDQWDSEIKLLYLRVGEVGRSISNNIADIVIEYADWEDRRKSEVIISEMREVLKDIKGVEISFPSESKGPSSSNELQFEITSEYREDGERVYNKILQYMEGTGNFYDIDEGSGINKFNWEVRINKDLATKHNVDVQKIGRYIKMVTDGVIIDFFEDKDIILKLPEENHNFSELEKLTITIENGKEVPIINFVDIVPTNKISSLNRYNDNNTISISANLRPGILLSEQINILNEWVSRNLDLTAEGVSIKYTGDTEDQQETQTFLMNAFLLAIASMVLIFLLQFNSFKYSWVVLSAVFFSIIGVFIALALTGKSFSIVMCGMAIISLAGIVVNNNIIFIDRFKKYAEDKESVDSIDDIIFNTAMDRIRPILLTTVTTVLGLIPMAYALNINFLELTVTIGAPSSQWWQTLSISMVGGIIFATVITLTFTPLLLKMFFYKEIEHKVGEFLEKHKLTN